MNNDIFFTRKPLLLHIETLRRFCQCAEQLDDKIMSNLLNFLWIALTFISRGINFEAKIRTILVSLLNIL